MKSLSIHRDANTVYLDGLGKTVDCSKLDSSISVVQWDAKKGTGWIEYVQDHFAKPHEGKAHKPIKDIKDYEALIEVWHGVMTYEDLSECKKCDCEITNAELTMADRKRDGWPVDQLKVERDAAQKRKDAVIAKYRKAKVKG